MDILPYCVVCLLCVIWGALLTDFVKSQYSYILNFVVTPIIQKEVQKEVRKWLDEYIEDDAN